MTLSLTFALLLASPTVPALVDLGHGRYRATVIQRGSGLSAATRAQLRLNAVARRQCRGRGAVVSEGLEVNRGPRRNQVAVSETFSCQPR